MGSAEKTEYPTDFEDLLRRADTVIDVTERILKASEALLEPNPGKSYLPIKIFILGVTKL